jgi:N6-adenosine-specific RNA methylase IME4
LALTDAAPSAVRCWFLTGPAITITEYKGFQAAYEFFNADLFGSTLPNLMVTLQRKARACGYFSPGRFQSRADENTAHELAHRWQQVHGKPRRNGDPHYKVMDLDAIKALPVGHLARPDAILMLRSTGAMLPEALDVLHVWSAKYLSQIIWRKVTRNPKVRVGTGYRVRSCHEPVLLASFGGRQQHKAFPLIFDGLAREHSRKPDEFYDIVLARTPGLDRCDLFSRETRSSFDGWGNEHGKFDEVV